MIFTCWPFVRSRPNCRFQYDLPSVVVLTKFESGANRVVSQALSSEVTDVSLPAFIREILHRRDVRLPALAHPVRDFCEVMFSTLLHRQGTPEHAATLEDARSIVEKVQRHFLDAQHQQQPSDSSSSSDAEVEGDAEDIRSRTQIYVGIMEAILEHGVGFLADEINQIHREFAGLPIPTEQRERRQILQEFSQYFFDE